MGSLQQCGSTELDRALLSSLYSDCLKGTSYGPVDHQAQQSLGKEFI